MLWPTIDPLSYEVFYRQPKILQGIYSLFDYRDNEVKQLRREAKIAEDQMRQLEREAQVN